MRKGETPSVLAMSWGSGDIHKDDITVVFLDQEGRMRDHTRIANLTDHEPQEELLELIQRRKPEVVVIGGFTIATTKLVKNMQTFVQGNAVNHDGSTDHDFGYQLRHDPLGIPVIYVHDEVARLFQHSKRAEQEFGTLSTLVKYCVGLARFAQSPLNEYAALGEDITAISFDEESQNLVGVDRPGR
jgi:transcription elongation factor SPT6